MDNRLGGNFAGVGVLSGCHFIVPGFNCENESIKALTGTNSISEAWEYILPCGLNCVDKKIAIKVNFNNRDCTASNTHCPSYQVINALITQLIEQTDISTGNINVLDASRSIPSYWGNQLYSGVLQNYHEGSQDPNHCISGRTCLSRAITWADYVINMPILRTHGGAGVTLSLKNHLGSTEQPSTFHGSAPNYDFFKTDPGQNSLVQLNILPFIKNRTILVVADALYGLKCGGPNNESPDGSCGIKPYPNSIFLSTDPIAVDSVMIDYLESRGASFSSSRNPRVTYSVAAQAGLGNYETDSGFNYSLIDLIQCDNGICPGTGPVATPTSEPGVSFKELLAGWLGSVGDKNGDGKVNSLDWL